MVLFKEGTVFFGGVRKREESERKERERNKQNRTPFSFPFELPTLCQL